jgi:hypothetical protein
VLVDTADGTCVVRPSELDVWLDVARRLSASALSSATAGRLRVLAARLGRDLGRTRSAVRVAVFPAEQEAFVLSMIQARARADLVHVPIWRCRTCGRHTQAPTPATGRRETARPQSRSQREALFANGATEAAARLRSLVQGASDVLTGVARDAVPCPGCGGLERVQGSEPACPRDGTPQLGDVLGDCPTCGTSVLGPALAWSPATPRVQLGRRQSAIAIDAADPQEPLVLVHRDESALLSTTDQEGLRQVAVLLTTLPPVDQPQPLTDVLVPFVRRLAAHQLVPARGPRLLTVSREERDLLDTLPALLAARRAAESRSKLICVSCGCTRPDDRDARRQEHDRARRRTLLGTAASAAVLSVASGNPAPLALLGKSFMRLGSGTHSTCPTCAEPVAVSAAVPVCPRCLGDVRVPGREACDRCGHRFPATASAGALFARSRDQTFWVDLADPPGRPPQPGRLGRSGGGPPERALIRTVDGTVRLEDGDVVVRSSVGTCSLPTHLIRDVVLIEPRGADPGWVRFIPAAGSPADSGEPPVPAAASVHQDPCALLVDPPQMPAARSVQAWIRSRQRA